MATDNGFIQEQNRLEYERQTYGAVMKELGSSTKDLIHSEFALLLAEFKQVSEKVNRHASQLIIFGFLLGMSVVPFLAFLVIALGDYLGGQYALSSVIVAIACALINGPIAYRAYRKLKKEDLRMPHVTASLKKEMATVKRKIEDLKTSAKGESHESH